MQLTDKVHELLEQHLKAGDLAIDATAGNGHDTLYLANKVGESGKVIAIDIQEAALQSTREKLSSAKLTERVVLHCADHAVQLQALCQAHTEAAACILFNLGYLPGSDKSIQTQASSTQQALEAAHQLLRSRGLLCVTAYRGHPGGMEEAQVVEDWMRAHEKDAHALDYYVPPAKNTPPVLWVLQKA
ncbi:class I SAM-dependent methyltransferase [Coraliomargarita sp. W4R53]